MIAVAGMPPLSYFFAHQVEYVLPWRGLQLGGSLALPPFTGRYHLERQ